MYLKHSQCIHSLYSVFIAYIVYSYHIKCIHIYTHTHTEYAMVTQICYEETEYTEIDMNRRYRYTMQSIHNISV